MFIPWYFNKYLKILFWWTSEHNSDIISLVILSDDNNETNLIQEYLSAELTE